MYVYNNNNKTYYIVRVYSWGIDELTKPPIFFSIFNKVFKATPLISLNNKILFRQLVFFVNSH